MDRALRRRASACAAVIADGAGRGPAGGAEQLRHDVDQIKVMASGGAMSPGDELDTTQYSVEELRAAVDEGARAVRTCVLAHAVLRRAAVRRALEAGVRSIEHGDLIDAERRAPSGHAGAYLVPTMATYEAIARDGRATASARTSCGRSSRRGTGAWRACHPPTGRAARSASGSDLLGDMAASSPARVSSSRAR